MTAKSHKAHIYFIIILVTAFVFMAGLTTFPDSAQANRKYASIVIEANTGRVLYSRNADKSLHPASLTKMMTLLLAFEALDENRLSKNERIYFSRRAVGMVPSKLGLPRGSTMRVEDAIYVLVTKSANDVAVALAEHIAGTEWRFSRIMTEKAKEIGMRHTRFQNASGLYHPHQRSTARDMAVLSRYIILNYPHYYRYFSTSSYRYRGRTYHSHNRLMSWYDGMDGLKTGYIAAAGFNLASSAVRDGNRLIGVVFGGRSTRSRDKHMARILNSSFARLSSLRTASADLPVPPEKPGFRKTKLVASAEHLTQSAQTAAPLPYKKPEDLVFSPSSSFRLARFEKTSDFTKNNKHHSSPHQEKEVPEEHFEMLARVLGQDGFDNVIGQGDFDPAVFKRIETGLMALSAHTGIDRFTPTKKEPQETASSIYSIGKRVFGRLFSSEQSASSSDNARLINGFPVPPLMPENRLWDQARQDTWSVQIGAFNDRAKTNTVLYSALSSLSSDLNHAKALVIPLRSSNHIIYRARLTRLEKKEAFEICRKLKDCMPIAP